ncbi:hypothetical protein D3C85_1607830 [compost metagenome]
MRQRHDELLRVLDQFLLNEVGPELSGYLELLINFNRLAYVDGTVRFLFRVVQLAQGGVPRSRIVPFVGAFFPCGRELLKYGDFPIWHQFFQQRS